MSSAAAAASNVSTSLKVFRSFLHIRAEDNTVDASQIHSRACYEMWLASRGVRESDEMAKRFYRTLSNHVSGVDGRSPFEPSEEYAILLILRVKQRWPCFPAHLKYGCAGYRSKGFMEKQLLGQVPKKRTNSKQQLLQLVEEEGAAEAGEEEEEEEETFADLHPNDFQFAQWVVESFPQYRAACTRLGTNLWESIMNVARFIILGRTPAVTMLNDKKEEYAQQLCANGQQQQDNRFVIVWDGLATEYSHRFVAQNAISIGYFGNVLAGTARWPIIEECEIARVVRAGLWMVHNNFGKDYALSALQMRCVDGVVRRFNATLWLDPNTYFYVVLSGTMLYE